MSLPPRDGGVPVPPADGLACPVWHRQGPAARYGRCLRRPVGSA
jgi:hypothetical protein